MKSRNHVYSELEYCRISPEGRTVTLLVVWRSGWVDGESSGVGEAKLTVLKEDGGSFVEAQGHCGIGRSGECYRVLISDTKTKVQACGLVDAQQK